MTEGQRVATPHARMRHARINGVDAYHRAVAGVDIRAVRAGAGGRPTEVASATNGRITTTTSRIGFPMLTHTEIGDDRILMAHYWRAPPGSLQTGVHVEPDMMLAYGPRVQHVGSNREGLAFSFATTTVEELYTRAAELGTDLSIPGPGEVRRLTVRPDTALLVATLSSIRMSPSGHDLPEPLLDELLSGMTRAFANPEQLHLDRHGPWIPSRSIVYACIEYAESVGRRPSLAELCVVARVSERRVRMAFVDLYDLPPSMFFRLWALSRANERLAGPVDLSETVTSVALELGFGNVGRFAEYYRQLFDEPPSVTLRRGRAARGVSTGRVLRAGTCLLYTSDAADDSSVV